MITYTSINTGEKNKARIYMKSFNTSLEWNYFSCFKAAVSSTPVQALVEMNSFEEVCNSILKIIVFFLALTFTTKCHTISDTNLETDSTSPISLSTEMILNPSSSESPNSIENSATSNSLLINLNRMSRVKQNDKNILYTHLNDLLQEESSNVEKRSKQTSKIRSQQKSRASSKSASSKKRQNSKLSKASSSSSRNSNRNKYNSLKVKLLPYSAYQQRLFYRPPLRDYSSRPVKIVNPKIIFYDFDDYYDYFDDRNKIRADYDSREERDSKESLEDVEDKESVEASTEVDDETTTESTTTTESNQNNTSPSFHGYEYGPSHGHEHVSFTYPPYYHDNNNYWHGQQQFPSDNTFYNPNPYLGHFRK